MSKAAGIVYTIECILIPDMKIIWKEKGKPEGRRGHEFQWQQASAADTSSGAACPAFITRARSPRPRKQMQSLNHHLPFPSPHNTFHVLLSRCSMETVLFFNPAKNPEKNDYKRQ